MSTEKTMMAPERVLKRRKLTTQRQWRRQKRREWRAVQKAMQTFGFGSAFVNGYEIYKTLGHQATQLERALSPKEWGK